VVVALLAALGVDLVVIAMQGRSSAFSAARGAVAALLLLRRASRGALDGLPRSPACTSRGDREPGAGFHAKQHREMPHDRTGPADQAVTCARAAAIAVSGSVSGSP
jgi:hypothetical protein